MIEILVTVGIMAIGLLGVSAMQLNALRSGQGAIDRGGAALLVTNMAERMRANTAAVNNGEYIRTEAKTRHPISAYRDRKKSP